MKKTIALFIFLSIFIYVCFAFVNWEFNPYVWGESKRGAFIFFMSFNLVVSPLIIKLSET